MTVASLRDREVGLTRATGSLAQPVRGLSPAQVEAHLLAGSAQALDVRDPATIAASGHIPGAVHLPDVGGMPDIERFTVVYGTTNEESQRAAEALTSIADVAYLAGGFSAWQDAEMAIAGLAAWHSNSIPTTTITESRTA